MPDTTTTGTIKLDHYEVLTRDDGAPFELGRGAMGITYKAVDTNLRMVVALKVINTRFLNSEMARTRFVREARAAAKIRHRHVASVFHLGIDGDAYFYAMEFIDGETVESLIKRTGPQPPLTALRIAHQVARALHAAEQHGLVHRDIKPANLMIVKEDDEICVKVIDFGLVKLQDADREEESPTMTGAGFFGTPQFASPEQLREEKLDVRSDIYSLGATLWYMIAGQAPFGGTLAQVMTQQLGSAPPFEKLSQLPPPVEKLLARMLAKPADDRPQTASALRLEIEETIEKVAGGPGAAAARAVLEDDRFATVIDDQASRTGSHPTFQPGTMVAGRYEILRPLRESNLGSEFQARDESRCDIRLVALHPQHVANAELFTRLEREVVMLRTLEHPNLLRVESLEVVNDSGLLLLEWTNGFSLLEVLRARHEISAAEVIPLLEQMAAGVDYAIGAGVKRLSLALHRILIHFPGGLDAGRNLRETPVTSWPAFIVKLSPLDMTGQAGLSETWSGGQTMVGDEAVSVSADADDPRASVVRALGTVAYELLGGKLEPLVSPGTPPRFVPLSTLTEGGNQVLKRTFDAPGSFASALEFATFLGDLQGLSPKGRTAPPLVPPPTPRTASATRPPTVAPSVSATTRAPSAPPVLPPPPLPVSPPPKKSGGLLVAAGTAAVILALGGYLIIAQPWRGHNPAGPGPGTTVTGSTPSPVGSSEPVETGPAPQTPTRQDQLKAAVARAETLELAVTGPETRAAQAETQRLAAEAKGNAAEANARDEDAQAALAEANAKLPDVITAWVGVAKGFPEATIGQSRLEILLDAVRKRQRRITEEEFAAMDGPLNDAANVGVVGAMMLLGDAQYRSAPATAFHWYSQAAAEKGHPPALAQVGLMLSNGAGTERDLKKAADYFERAADLGDAAGEFSLGECFLLGKGVPVDEKKAIDLLQAAAKQGNLRAMNRLGVCYNKGKAVKKDTAEALRLFSEAAERGNTEADGNLGVLYITGDGVPEDKSKGAKLFQVGAEKGDAFCMFLLAQCFEEGTGTAMLPKEAETWYKRAAEAGHPKAREWCAKHGIGLATP